MITFKRTLSGLNNMHLFYEVDFIVYVEGGTVSYTKEDICNGNYNSNTKDILFWESLFEVVANNIKVKFKSVGSKNTVKNIALDILKGNLNNTLVAMDKEFDCLLRNQIQHPKVLYTYGYSWENDVWNSEVIQIILEELSGLSISKDCLNNNFSTFLREIKIAVIADAYLFTKNGNSFFPRPKGYMAMVNCTPSDLPHVLRGTLISHIVKKNLKLSTLRSFARRKQIEINRQCYGHLIADYGYQVVLHYLKNRLQLPGIPPEYVQRIAIKKYFSTVFVNNVSYKYYNLILNQALVA